MGLQDLTPRQRAALVLHDVLGWPPGDVAELLDTSVESIEGLLASGRAAYDRRGLGAAAEPRSE